MNTTALPRSSIIPSPTPMWVSSQLPTLRIRPSGLTLSPRASPAIREPVVDVLAKQEHWTAVLGDRIHLLDDLADICLTHRCPPHDLVRELLKPGVASAFLMWYTGSSGESSTRSPSSIAIRRGSSGQPGVGPACWQNVEMSSSTHAGAPSAADARAAPSADLASPSTAPDA